MFVTSSFTTTVFDGREGHLEEDISFEVLEVEVQGVGVTIGTVGCLRAGLYLPGPTTDRAGLGLAG